MNDKPYKLEYHGTDVVTNPTDITNYVISIEKFTDVGTGEIVSAKIMLDARYGDFVTQANSGKTPILKQYEVLRLEVSTFHDSGEKYSRYLVVDDLSPQVNANGQFLSVELLGRERYLQKMLFPGHFYFVSFRKMIGTIVSFYNKNKGSKQPSINPDIPELPDHTWGIFDFSEETNCYDALMEVVKRCTLPVAAGGAGEYYGMTFTDVGTTGLLLRVAPQGFPDDKPTDIETLEKPMQLTEVKEPSKASIVVVKGKPGTGTMPPQPALFRSYIEEYQNIPAWRNDVTYRDGAVVRWEGFVYQAVNPSGSGLVPNKGIEPDLSSSRWDDLTLPGYIAKFYEKPGDFNYSPWTKDKAAVWKNYCGNPDGTFYDSGGADNQYNAPCVGDSNWVIRESTSQDKAKWRDSVDFRLSQVNQSLLDNYLYSGTSGTNKYINAQYEGLRILCDSAPSSSNTPTRTFIEQFYKSGSWQKDEFGVSFQNKMVTLGVTGNWIVFRTTQNFDECIVWHEGKTYQYNFALKQVEVGNQNFNRPNYSGTSSGGWVADSDQFLGNDGFHYPANIKQVPGLYLTAGTSGIGNLGSNSGIEITYKFKPNREGEKAADPAAVPPTEYEPPLWDRVVSAITNGGLGISLKSIIEGITTFTDDITAPLYNWLAGTHLNNLGWWATLFSTPFPRNKSNGITENVGQLFGGSLDTGRVQVPVLDLRNLNYTPTGQTSFGADDADNLGQIQGIKFLFNFDITGISFDTWRGNLPFRCFIETTRGDIIVCDKQYRFQEVTQLMEFPISEFKPYRARIPVALTLTNIVSRILNPELAVTEIFERRKIKRIGLQLMLDYDDQGRYDPITFFGFMKSIIAVLPNNTLELKGTIDYFHFTTDNIVIARNNTDSTYTQAARDTDISKLHLTNSVKRYPNISNVAQLQKIANTELDLDNFQHDRWTATYMDIANVRAERTVFIKDQDLISETDKTNTANTRKLIVKKVTYSVGDRSTNSGMKTTINLYKKVIPRS